MGDSPGAAAPAAASAEAETTLGARAAAALAGSGSSSGAPAVGAALPSDDWPTWARQVEFARIHKRLDDNFAEVSASASTSREAAAAFVDQVANMDIIVRQFVVNNSDRVASRDDGDAQKRHRLYLWVSRPGSPTISPVWRGSTPSATRLRWGSWAFVRTPSATTVCCPSQTHMQCCVIWLTATS